MLTEQKLKDMPLNYNFAKGIFKLNRHSTKKYKWVAVTGVMDDWCIYYGDPELSYDEIADRGIKLYDERMIKDLVPYEYAAFKKYRY